MTSDDRVEGGREAPRMRRRAVLAGATWLAGATLGAAGSAAAGEHEGHAAGSAGAAGPRYSEAKAFKRRASLVAATNDCVSRGQACLSHCMETFVAGDTTMAECAQAVQEMLATCQAFGVLAANDSVALRPMAQACIAVCEECEKQCRVHEDHQPECRECADACAALVREARKVLV